ncbi:MAG TPA: VWA-like domain-containing protein [Gammaproteobacteria bacterium]|nr:VWA-like domain-containing protein [Gammaproteobacteria bacterium]
MSDEIETKLSAARTRLILDRPFLGALVLRMPMKAGDPKWCKTIGTDARAFYYNPAWIDSLSLEQTQFALAHEALHCALSHFARREHRNHQRWDVACDLAINPILIREGMTAVPGALYNIGYEGMMAEEIYPLVKENNEEEPHDQHLYGKETKSSQQQDPGEDSQPDKPDDSSEDGAGGGSDAGTEEHDTGAPQALSEAEKEQLSIQWRQRLAGAAQQAMQAGKLGGALRRLVDHLLQPQLPWRMLLARYMTAVARDDYSYMRPSRREGEAIFPSLRSSQTDIVVVLDTSGSIRAEEMREFVTEIDAIKGQVRARVTLLACDAALSPEGPWVFEPWEAFELPADIRGGGGTRFTPPFEWLDESGCHPDLLVYFTDAEGEFPKREPRFPVLWLVKGRGPVPWGQRIQLN